MDNRTPIERDLARAAKEPLNRRARRNILQRAKRAGVNMTGRKALVRVPVDLGIKKFKKGGPSRLREEYKQHAWKAHADATQRVLNKNKVQEPAGGSKSGKATAKVRPAKDKP